MTAHRIVSARIPRNGDWFDVTALALAAGLPQPKMSDVYALPGCTCSTNPYNCPQGQALVAAIHQRKGNQ